ncbi:MAG: transglutaminase domain-containing protein [candidate division WOR-3 bacterium]
MRQVVVLIIGFLIVSLSGQEQGITNQPSEVSPTAGRRKAVLFRPQPLFPYQSKVLPLPSDTGWGLIDSITLHRIIPAGERLAVVFDSANESLKDTLLLDYLTDLGKEAVAVAPDWLKDDLADKFRRIGQVLQNKFADLILNCPDKRYYDELCFQVAHLSPIVLTSVSPQILIDNVQYAYQIDRELQYVDIVDYGDPLQGGDYYSTTRYRAIVQGETTEVEIPKEIYYWWVIMPKVSDEPVEYVYERFWRDYLFYYADEGYPLLKEKLANIKILWNGEKCWWQNQGMGYEDTLPAVCVVSRWVAHTLPYPAQGNRPIQPNQIAHEHNGNCGEVQDLLCAAARTALIPAGCVLDINEDHVWNEIYWQDSMFPWQVDLGCGPTNIKNPGIAYDQKYGGGKQVSGVWEWRNDGYQRSVVGTYSDVCTLTVEVRDSTLRPVDGAIIKISSEFWYGGIYECFYGVTDRSGRYTTPLGDWQNYYLVVVSPLGVHSAGRIIDSAECVPGTHFFYACTLSGRLDSLRIVPDSGTPINHYRLDVTYTVNRESYYGIDCYNSGGAQYYALIKTPGAIDFFLTSQAGFNDYLAGKEFRAFKSDENTFQASHSHILTGQGNHYLVFSNEEQDNLTAFLDVTVKLYKWGIGIAETKPSLSKGNWFNITPNPGRKALRIRLLPEIGYKVKLRIMDVTGKVVWSSTVAGSEIIWEGRDAAGRLVPPNVYFVEVSGKGGRSCQSIIWLGL